MQEALTRDKKEENNIFVKCAPSVHLNARGLSWASFFFNRTLTLLFDQLKEMKYQEPPYHTRYPELLTLDKGNPAFPLNNRIIRNVSYGGRWIDFYDSNAFDFSVVTMRDNLIADTALCRRQRKDQTGWDAYYLDIERKDGYVLYTDTDRSIKEEFRENTFVTGDPAFESLQRHDFRLKSSSRPFALGFKPIPIDKIDLQVDRFRRTLPAPTQ